MLPSICRCCGMAMGLRAPRNPNICSTCDALDYMDYSALPPTRDSVSANPASIHRAQSPHELEQMLELEGPSVLECFEALEQAKRALTEAALQEQKQPASPANHS